jgi:DNA polymerase-3 subunit epsilon
LEDVFPDYAADREAAIRWAREMMERDFVILDTETTGLDCDDEAVSIAVVSKNGVILLNTLLCHQKVCDPRALATHRITWDMTRSAPHFREIAPLFFEAIKDREVVAYNVQYDMRIISQMMIRYAIDPPHPDYGKPSLFHDAMGSFAQFYGEWSDWHQSYRWKKLTFAAAHLDIPADGAHGAAADCLLTLRVVEAMAGEKLRGE